MTGTAPPAARGARRPDDHRPPGRRTGTAPGAAPHHRTARPQGPDVPLRPTGP